MIGVVLHDAGGAEIISSYIRRHKLECNFCLEGPAEAVVARKLGAVKKQPLHNLVERSEWLLCGTSFRSDLEWRAIGLSKSAGKRCIAFLDHWINYRLRFIRYGELRTPDEIWLGDEVAVRIAKETLPDFAQTFVPNAYFLDIQDELKTILLPQRFSGKGLHILYVCEPLRDEGRALYNDERYWGYTEEEALTYFLSNVRCLSNDINRIVVRPHPKERSDKYDWAKQQYDLPIVCGETKSLLEQIVACDIVVGCATMAMVVALLAGKRVLSCIPPNGKTAMLPHAEIENMNQLILANR